ncbi:hypothetical protein CONPUDRAFT_100586 [Coniophora puteana RWD-64-598 SS2]|uniref:BTB domain-containing protein n=1 Tax=Coniophora puteana (strain RWD-64-598) TaxID=741705 RepID=A0A5M3MZK2_CONPW|nr:uncharacterized protein CONPUDRAFT_100586 [Coniophora puteana RWD-64-598 SS2]EIW84456.1 hypothetical protein CONPUDRAFT_100586 [Coniophora puteana RWD-64-598 SS2]
MSLLHVYFNLRRQQAFQRLLEGPANKANKSSGAPGTSAGKSKSWTKKNTLNLVPVDVNCKDQQGRTVLHLACSAVEPSSIEYIRLLLAQPGININIMDSENHWTPLHRALYGGHIAAAIILLKRPDIDVSIKDYEGYTAADLYNSTLRITNPDGMNEELSELLTWGTNRNATLGVGDGSDRTYPEQVTIPYRENETQRQNMQVERRFSPIHVREISMSRLHTVVVTSEARDNVRLCGFGSGGRLGSSQHTQYGLMALPEFSHTIVSVALGQDHTLALTSTGEVLSWGLNRFAQLGYVVESATGVGRLDEPVQASPRKIVGPLRREVVVGVAACKTGSACWTSTELFTWGTNGGQLGYAKNAAPVQILPRKVTLIVQPVTAVSMTDTVTACLLETGEVHCIYNDAITKISIPTQSFPSEISVYRPPHTVKGPRVVKLTSSEDTFAALSSNREVFIFSSVPTADAGPSSGKAMSAFKPQRVWALRRQFSAVKDVGLGADGSIIVCTQSGHVFVRTRNTKAGQGGKAFKFHRVPYAQRVVAVCANSTGAFGAVRVDCAPEPIRVTGRTLVQDIAAIQPYLSYATKDDQIAETPSGQVDLTMQPTFDFDEEADDATILDDIAEFARVLELLGRLRKSSPYDMGNLPHGADVLIQVGEKAEIPAHKIILSARSSPLRALFSGGGAIQDATTKVTIRLSASSNWPRVQIRGSNTISVLLLLHHIYSDRLLAIWDRRVSVPFDAQLKMLNVVPSQVRLELQILARLLHLPNLSAALESPGKRLPVPCAPQQLQELYEHAQSAGPKMTAKTVRGDPMAPDVEIRFKNHTVYSHSAVLRSRSGFFNGLFDDKEWTVKRWDSRGAITLDLSHMDWHIMEFVMLYLCCGIEEELFANLDFAQSIDDVIEFMFDVIAAANELLLDRLMLICSQVILKHLNPMNACYILTDAHHFNAVGLMYSVHGYIAANLEMFLEGRMLDDVAHGPLRGLTEFIRKEQLDKSPVSRSEILGREAMEKHKEWVEMQDWPAPVEEYRPVAIHRSPRMSRVSSITNTNTSAAVASAVGGSPVAQGLGAPGVGVPGPAEEDELFAMDADVPPALNLDEGGLAPPAGEEGRQKGVSPKTSLVWKRTSSAPRTDLKSIMAEAESSKKSRPVPSPGTSLGLGKPSPSSPSPLSRMEDRSRGSLDRMSSGLGVESSRSSGGPWRTTGTPATPSSFLAQQQQDLAQRQQRTPSSSGVVPQAGGTAPRLLSQPQTPTKTPGVGSMGPQPRSSPGPKPQAATPGLGPVITPMRQAPASPSTSRRVSNNNSAWTVPSVQPIVQPSLPPTTPASASASGSGSGSGPTPSGKPARSSFAAIQQAQLEQGSAASAKDRRSLREIQEEEQVRQREEQERRQEEEFLRWWAEEEVRVQGEEGGGGSVRGGAGGRKGGKGRERPKGGKKGGPGSGASGLGAAAGEGVAGEGSGREKKGGGRESDGRREKDPDRSRGKPRGGKNKGGQAASAGGANTNTGGGPVPSSNLG